MERSVGIDQLSFYVPQDYLDLADLAAARQVTPDKYEVGLDQRLMALPAPDEDTVTMAAAAALPILEGVEDIDSIGALLVATESAVDHSKATAAFVHRLLGLPPTCMIYDVRQACAAGTAGLRQAAAMVALEPDMKALVIASDVAHYELEAAAEPTQGAGACAILVSAQPRVCELEPSWGVHAEETFDFWRPLERITPVVAGKTSLLKYLECLAGSWQHYCDRGGSPELDACCFHLPFGAMARKAAHRLARESGGCMEDLRYQSGLQYGRVIGNTYTASLYIALCALLEQGEPQPGQRIGMYSYGSGSLGLYFSLRVQAGYRAHILGARHSRMLACRNRLTVAEYEQRHATYGAVPEAASMNASPFRWAGIEQHRRLYESRDTLANAMEASGG